LIKKNSIVCYGEVLWDVFSTHKSAGGAPMNVAFHAGNFGMNAQIISAVGNDQLGKELLFFLSEKGVKTDFIHTNYTFPTGTVQVKLNENGAAEYEITEPAAWDFLFTDAPIENAISTADLFLFGSLICRKEYNLKTLLQLIEKAQTSVFDVNLRPPFYKKSVLEILLQKADIVKMNDEELEIIAKWYSQKGNLNSQMAFLMRKFNIKILLMTAGKNGAYCMHREKLYFQKSFHIEVQDTVGSGDAFLATFLFKMCANFPWQECLKFACATGALVATKSGGTPIINQKSVIDFIKSQK